MEKRSETYIKPAWQPNDTRQWTIWHWFFQIFNLHPFDPRKSVPKHSKTDTIPYLPASILHKWVLAHAIVPMLVHHTYLLFSGANLGPLGAGALYGAWLHFTSIRQIHVTRSIGQRYGYLDGDKHERDGVPDLRIRKVAMSLILAVTVRPALIIFLAYDKTKTPVTMSLWWLFIELTVFPLMVDLWFYWYHRLVHEVPLPWEFHRTHHLTKHPNAVLVLYADGWQELIEIVVIPSLAFYSCRLLGLPMGFYETWVAHAYVIFTEVFGHSGLRVHGSPAISVGALLIYWGMELVVEDHDLHHRTGWKKSCNYGKQTRVWDTIFGTKGPRIESVEHNVDYNTIVTMPIFATDTE